MPEQTDVAIIGAGPAGLAVGACLRQAGVSFIILERDQKVASSWHRHYERLHLHTVKQLSCLPYMPFPAAYPRYVPRNLMIEYLDRYAAKFDLKPRFGDAARSVCRDGNDWRVQGTSSSVSASHVVVASGFNAEPVIPSIPGMEKFGGKLIHSVAYANAKPFSGQSVLVIGMGNSGAEVALDLSEGRARTSISIRNGVHIVPRDLFGIPIQLVAMLATRVLPSAANETLFPRILDLALGDLSKHGIRRPTEGILRRVATSAKIPVIDVGTVRKISKGAIRIEPGISAITEDGAIFRGGGEGKFDAIILATGYRPNYRSFLQADDIKNPADKAPAPQNMDSTIYFVGFKNSVSGLLRQISKEAVQVAHDIVRRRNEIRRRNEMMRRSRP
jgi:cation diffusion facilitator CzcD-associated flavoprotein CzcO